MTPEWLSAHLDGELAPRERAVVDEALAADRALVADYEALARVRRRLRDASVDVPVGAFERVMAAVEGADRPGGRGGAATSSTGVAPFARRRVPTLAAVAAAVAIIAAVVGGLGGTASLPALGDFVARHEVAAAVVAGAPMPDEMDDMTEMPMDDALAVAPPMPGDMEITHAYATGGTVQLVYVTSAGEPISVFRHVGDAAIDELGEGSVVRAAEADMWSAPRDDAYVAVIDGTGYVWIVVSDDPHDEMMDAMMHDLPTRSPSLGDRVRGVAELVVEPFGFGA